MPQNDISINITSWFLSIYQSACLPAFLSNIQAWINSNVCVCVCVKFQYPKINKKKNLDEENCSGSEKKKNPTLCWGLRQERSCSRQKRTVRMCVHSCWVSWTAPRQLKSRNLLMNSSATLLMSNVVQGHTYTEGSSSRSCVRKAAKIKNLPLFFSFPPPTSFPFKDPWYPWNVLPLEEPYQKPGMDLLFSFIASSSTFEACSVSLFLGMTCAALSPAATEAANLSPHPPRPQQMSLGGHWGGRGPNSIEAEAEKAMVALVVIIFWLTHDKLCEELVCQVQVFERKRKKRKKKVSHVLVRPVCSSLCLQSNWLIVWSIKALWPRSHSVYLYSPFSCMLETQVKINCCSALV